MRIDVNAITSGGNRNPVNAGFGGSQERGRIDNFTGQACLHLANAQRNGAFVAGVTVVTPGN
jgi:hypothetical protein